MSALYYKFFQSGRLLGEGYVDVPFTVGRQTDPSLSSPVSVIELASHPEQLAMNEFVARKLVIVPLSNRSVPRLSLRVDLDSAGNILARNMHRAIELFLPTQDPIRPHEELQLGSGTTISFPEGYQLKLACQRPASIPSNDFIPTFQAEFDETDEDDESFLALRFAQDADSDNSSRLMSMIATQESTKHQEIAVRLVRTALEAFKEPPGSKEFFDAAGRAAIQMIDLDRVAVLGKEDDQWMCRTLSFRPGLDQSRAAARAFSHTLLAKMEENGRTTSVDPQHQSQSVWKSISEIDRAVAAPIFDDNKKIVGALYGDRLIGESANNQPIGELEAAMLEVLASGISSSMAIKQEQRLRSSMAQFFSPEVLNQLKRDRTLLDGRAADVSVLFCDIRGFSSVTEKIGPTQAIAWINDVLTVLSECVLNHDGVLVDYIGDELMAMWGAPGEQADHAERACRAALDMLAQTIPLGEKWKSVIPSKFGFGIGINSGTASVGNTGSQRKFKYGPIGNTVNLASRVQGVTKQIGVPGLVTGETARLAQRASLFQMRRLAKIRVVGIAAPIDLFQLCENEAHRNLCLRYEEALKAYESGDLKLAAGRLASLVQDYPDDRPTIILLSRTVELLTQPDREFDPVWNMTQK